MNTQKQTDESNDTEMVKQVQRFGTVGRYVAQTNEDTECTDIKVGIQIDTKYGHTRRNIERQRRQLNLYYHT